MKYKLPFVHLDINQQVVHSVQALKIQSGIASEVEDFLTVEEILSISINGESYTMTMRTPGNEEALARGILLSEDVYNDLHTNPIFSIIEKNEFNYITKVNVDIPERKIGKGILTKRNLVSVSSCGMCGKDEMDLTWVGEKIICHQKLNTKVLHQLFQKMSALQENFKYSGGSHASAACKVDGELLVMHEDIGRHNAVDKVIGSLLLENKLERAQILLVSGRVSYEIVNKCYRACIPFLAAVSAPSSMAVRYCEQMGITLLAFCREDKMTVYTQEERVEMGFL